MVPAGEPWLEVEGTLVSRNFRRSVITRQHNSAPVRFTDLPLENHRSSHGRAAGWGLKLHAHLSAAHRRLHEEAPRQRSTSSMTALIDLLVSTPALSSRRAADALGLTTHGARRMLDALESKSLVHELTGRNAFRLYAPASLAGFSAAI
jgi:hypothetical protein